MFRASIFIILCTISIACNKSKKIVIINDWIGFNQYWQTLAPSTPTYVYDSLACQYFYKYAIFVDSCQRFYSNKTIQNSIYLIKNKIKSIEDKYPTIQNFDSIYRKILLDINDSLTYNRLILLWDNGLFINYQNDSFYISKKYDYPLTLFNNKVSENMYKVLLLWDTIRYKPSFDAQGYLNISPLNLLQHIVSCHQFIKESKDVCGIEELKKYTLQQYMALLLGTKKNPAFIEGKRLDSEYYEAWMNALELDNTYPVYKLINTANSYLRKQNYSIENDTIFETMMFNQIQEIM